MITASVIADSITNEGNRITTMIVTMPRFILAEFNTHRMFSRNTSSSRAIPFEKMVKSVQDDPFIPIAWQKDHKGMQGTEYFTKDSTVDYGFGPEDLYKVIDRNWREAKIDAINWATRLNNVGVTKQLANRLLEPFMWTTVIVTATEWENFFELRCPRYEYLYSQGIEGVNYSEYTAYFRSKKSWIKFKETLHKESVSYKRYDDNPNWLTLNKGQAEIHMMALAEAMWDAYNESTPKLKTSGEWHIPFEDKISRAEIGAMAEQDGITLTVDGNITDYAFSQYAIQISTAMCARTSYTVVGEEDRPSNYENDMTLHDRLLHSKHMSPFEHCARVPLESSRWEEGVTHYTSNNPQHVVQGDFHKWSANFKGFIQYRQLIEQANEQNQSSTR